MYYVWYEKNQLTVDSGLDVDNKVAWLKYVLHP